MILGGDLNAGMHSAGLRSLVGRGWVGDAAEVGIDHLLVRGADLGTRRTFADVGQTLAELFGVGALPHGTSFLQEITT